MLNKIFLAVLFISFLVMSGLTYFCYDSLTHIGFSPKQIVENFNSYRATYFTALWVSSAALLVFSNILLWSSRRAWSLWISFVFFAFFLILQTFWLGNKLQSYLSVEFPSETSLGLGGIAGAFACIVAAIGVFFNQFLVIRLRDKMFPTSSKDIPTLTTDTEKG
jgi:hypothetical protein